MFDWFETKLPLGDPDRQWIEVRMAWLVDQFGLERMSRVPMVLPTEEFFPEPFSLTPACLHRVLERVCQYMNVDRHQIDLRFYREPRPEPFYWLPVASGGTAGLYEATGDRATVWLEVNNIVDLESVVATLAHEVGHHLLLGSGRIALDAEDHEPLTDLLTVFLGFGIFTANSVIHEKYWQTGQWSGWHHGRHGYLPARLLGYAIAVFARHRNEIDPAWADLLRLDARESFRAAQQHLIATGSCGLARDGICLPYPPAAHRPQQAPAVVDDEQNSPSADEDTDDDEPNWSGDDTSKADADDAFTLGVALANGDDHDAAVEAFSEAIVLDPEDGEVFQHRAMAYAHLGRFDAALRDSEQAVRLEPDDLDAYRVRAAVSHGAGRHDQAIEDWSRVLRIESEDADAYYQRGVARAARSDLERAVADFDQAIRYSPREPMYYQARAAAFEQLGRPEQAAADRAEAAARDPWATAT